MKLLISPNVWSCTVTALAMICDATVEQIYELIGHKGDEITHPELKEPLRRRGFAMNELTRAALLIDIALILVEETDIQEVGPNKIYTTYLPEWYKEMYNSYDGLLLGLGQSGVPHATAWNYRKQRIYDPNGLRYPRDLFRTDAFYAAVPVGKKDR